MRILVIEDDNILGSALQEFLREQGYAVDWVSNGSQVFGAVSGQVYQLLLLDLNLPDMNGLEVLKQLRAQGHQEPTLILTARDDVEDRVAGLDAGADDYVTKPFELSELAARVRTFARRQSGQSSPVIEVGPLQFDTVGREVRVHGERLNLSVRELSVLEMLMARPGRVVTKRQIVNSLSAWMPISAKMRSKSMYTGCASAWRAPAHQSRPYAGLVIFLKSTMRLALRIEKTLNLPGRCSRIGGRTSFSLIP